MLDTVFQQIRICVEVRAVTTVQYGVRLYRKYIPQLHHQI